MRQRNIAQTVLKVAVEKSFIDSFLLKPGYALISKRIDDKVVDLKISLNTVMSVSCADIERLVRYEHSRRQHVESLSDEISEVESYDR